MGYTVDSEGRVVDTSEYVEGKKKKGSSYSSTGILSLGRVFLFMFFGLLITTGVAVGLGQIFMRVFTAPTSDDWYYLTNAAVVYLIILIASGLSLIVLSILLNVFLYKGKSLWVPSILYVVSMGVLLSALTIFVDWGVLVLAFGITAGTFGLMALIAFLSKGNLSGLAIAGLGLLIGGLLLAGVNWILYMVTGGAWGWLNIAISFILLAAMMLITIYDMWRIKQTAENGAMNDNVAMYCAFRLYVDFVYLFMRVLRIVLYLMSRKN